MCRKGRRPGELFIGWALLFVAALTSPPPHPALGTVSAEGHLQDAVMCARVCRGTAKFFENTIEDLRRACSKVPQWRIHSKKSIPIYENANHPGVVTV
uniref:Secreted protein n=1 Tax=Steinernema glaseri TaxID=37863 RepID=A0A1I7XYH0_9BILA